MILYTDMVMVLHRQAMSGPLLFDPSLALGVALESLGLDPWFGRSGHDFLGSQVRGLKSEHRRLPPQKF